MKKKKKTHRVPVVDLVNPVFRLHSARQVNTGPTRRHWAVRPLSQTLQFWPSNQKQTSHWWPAGGQFGSGSGDPVPSCTKTQILVLLPCTSLSRSPRVTINSGKDKLLVNSKKPLAESGLGVKPSTATSSEWGEEDWKKTHCRREQKADKA